VRITYLHFEFIESVLNIVMVFIEVSFLPYPIFLMTLFFFFVPLTPPHFLLIYYSFFFFLMLLLFLNDLINIIQGFSCNHLVNDLYDIFILCLLRIVKDAIIHIVWLSDHVYELLGSKDFTVEFQYL
jgi:hypothetical protein